MDASSTIKITKRTDRTAFMFILQHLVKPLNTRLINVKKQYPAGSPQLEASKKARVWCEVHERKVGQIYIYDLDLRNGVMPINREAEKRKRKRLFYFCGGGWRMPTSGEHWSLLTELARKLPDATVTIVSYPLAPNSPAPTAFPQLMETYKILLQECADIREQVILAGDSSGGNIILCLALALLEEDQHAPHPCALMAICASTDMRKQNPDMKEVEKHDPILRIKFVTGTATLWCGEWDKSDPRVTPLLANVSLLARNDIYCHGVTAGYDVLGPDGVLFREKCRQAGVKGEWLDWDKQMHCFPLAWKYKLPESIEAKDWIIDVLQRTWNRALSENDKGQVRSGHASADTLRGP